MSEVTPQCVWPAACQLGEGPIWSPEAAAVWFVDILGEAVHRYEPAGGERRVWSTPGRPGFLARHAEGGLVVGLPDGLYRFDPDASAFQLLVEVEADRPENRLNDGAVGPDGALWFGSKNEPETEASGAWHRWSGEGPPHCFDTGYVVTNGPAFSGDGRTLFHADSVARRVYARSVGPDGEIGRNRLFAEIEPGAGYPDGLAIDAEDCLWVALWGGGGLRRYGTDGALLSEVRLPCDNVTKPCFGGADGRTLYVTTARAGLSPAQLADQPLAGALFALEAPSPGRAIPAFHPAKAGA